MEDTSIGIAVEVADPQRSRSAIRLALQAEHENFDLVVLTATEPQAGTVAGLDVSTVADWILASTSRIAVGIHLPEDQDGPDGVSGEMTRKGQATINLLSSGRLITSESDWIIASPDAEIGELAELARTGRTIVVPTRRPEEVRRVAMLRGALEGELATSRRRTRSARARRRPGINYDGVPASLQEVTIEPGDSDYRAVASTYLRGGSPGIVFQPRTPSEVADALAFAKAHSQLPLGIRSGGHGISGRSTNDGGIVIDLRNLNAIEVVDKAQHLVRVGPGATWKQVARTLDRLGWALGSGDYGGVGVGGLATAGGIGFLSREHGLTIDHLRGVEMVLADGSIVHASSETNSELFWGVRGAGANLGVVTAFVFQAHDLGEVGWAQLVLASSDLEATLLTFGEVVESTPPDTTVFLVTGRPHGGVASIQLYGLVDASTPDLVIERLMPYLQVGELVGQQVVLTRYAEVMGRAADVGPDGQHGFGEPVSRSAFLPRMTREFARDAAELLRTGRVFFFQVRSMGGAIAEVPRDATAFAHRDAAFQITAMGADRAALDMAWEKLLPHFDGLYLSFETDLRAERLERAFPPPVLARLHRLKRQVDPDNLLRDNFNINPTEPLKPLMESPEQRTAA